MQKFIFFQIIIFQTLLLLIVSFPSFVAGGPFRSITKREDGGLVGGRSNGHEIEVYESTTNGKKWNRIGSVANNININYGDIMFLAIPKTTIVFCAFREENSNHEFSVVVCRSDNNGYEWVYDSTVYANARQFVGAPWLFYTNSGDLQCYYDSEPLSTERGVKGGQYIAMQSKKGISGDWDKLGVIEASRDVDKNKLVRDGMASVIDLGNNRIMVVTEGIDDNSEGGEMSNVIRAIQSFDGGVTWDYAGRKIVYKSFIHEDSKKRYNAYCPMGARVGNGPVGVVFCTDEDSGGIPDKSSAPVDIRSCHVKYIRTLETFEDWGEKVDIYTEGTKRYVPGIVEYEPNKLLISVDEFYGNERYIYFDL